MQEGIGVADRQASEVRALIIVEGVDVAVRRLRVEMNIVGHVIVEAAERLMILQGGFDRRGRIPAAAASDLADILLDWYQPLLLRQPRRAA